MDRWSLRIAFVASLAAALLGAARPARADGARAIDLGPVRDESPAARARSLYDAGTQAFNHSWFLEAALDFEAAAAYKPSPVALYTAALSWERANAPDRAADDYTRALAAGDLPAESANAATQRLGALRRVLGAVTVSGSAGWYVQLDDHSELAAPATLYGAAGVHTLIVRAAGQPPQRLPVVLDPSGGDRAIQLPVATLATRDIPGGRSPSPPLAGRPIAGTVALGAAFTALLAGALLGIEALDARNAYRATPTRATYDHARSLEVWTDVALISGGALLAGGLVLVLWPAPRATAFGGQPRGRLVLAARPGSLFLQGAF
jgi:hypothetical protein